MIFVIAVIAPSSNGRTSDFDSDGAGSNPAGAAIIYALNSVVKSTRLIRGRSAVRICECVPIWSPRLKGRTPDSAKARRSATKSKISALLVSIWKCRVQVPRGSPINVWIIA